MNNVKFPLIGCLLCFLWVSCESFEENDSVGGSDYRNWIREREPDYGDLSFFNHHEPPPPAWSGGHIVLPSIHQQGPHFQNQFGFMPQTSFGRCGMGNGGVYPGPCCGNWGGLGGGFWGGEQAVVPAAMSPVFGNNPYSPFPQLPIGVPFPGVLGSPYSEVGDPGPSSFGFGPFPLFQQPPSQSYAIQQHLPPVQYPYQYQPYQFGGGQYGAPMLSNVKHNASFTPPLFYNSGGWFDEMDSPSSQLFRFRYKSFSDQENVSEPVKLNISTFQDNLFNEEIDPNSGGDDTLSEEWILKGKYSPKTFNAKCLWPKEKSEIHIKKQFAAQTSHHSTVIIPTSNDSLCSAIKADTKCPEPYEFVTCNCKENEQKSMRKNVNKVHLNENVWKILDNMYTSTKIYSMFDVIGYSEISTTKHSIWEDEGMFEEENYAYKPDHTERDEEEVTSNEPCLLESKTLLGATISEDEVTKNSGNTAVKKMQLVNTTNLSMDNELRIVTSSSKLNQNKFITSSVGAKTHQKKAPILFSSTIDREGNIRGSNQHMEQEEERITADSTSVATEVCGTGKNQSRNSSGSPTTRKDVNDFIHALRDIVGAVNDTLTSDGEKPEVKNLKASLPLLLSSIQKPFFRDLVVNLERMATETLKDEPSLNINHS